jgi:hypothetical protein
VKLAQKIGSFSWHAVVVMNRLDFPDRFDDWFFGVLNRLDFPDRFES